MTVPDQVTADDQLIERASTGTAPLPEDGPVGEFLAALHRAPLRAVVLPPQGEHARIPADHRIRRGPFLGSIPVAPEARLWKPASYDQQPVTAE